MVWRAILKSVQENPVPNDMINVNIEYFETVSNRTFTKGYNLHATNFLTKQSFLDYVANEIQTLTKFDNVITILKTYIGKELG